MPDATRILDAYVHDTEMPLPASDEVFVGDGNFRAIGAEFARHLVELGGLAENELLVDIGCGQGRTALPLTLLMSETGRYIGVDVVRDGIDWCVAHVAPRHPGFSFRHMDAWHPIYNPQGALSPTGAPVPIETGTADMVCLISVFTHLDPDMTVHYLREVSRILKPDGRCLATFFLIGEEDKERHRGEASIRYAFDLDGPGPAYSPPEDKVLGAVAHDEGWLRQVLDEVGLDLAPEPHYGFWRYEDPSRGVSYQDICILRRSDCG